MLHDKFLALQTDLNTALRERQGVIHNALLALLSGEHYLMLGPPGTAKSMLVDNLCARITDSTQFSWLMTADTTRDELFGPVDIVSWADRGDYKRMDAYALTHAHFAFLDEVYKAGSWILNTLLKMMQERMYFEASKAPLPVPLVTLFGASNETPEDDSLNAFDDRFALRDVVQYIQDDDEFIWMLTHAAPAPSATVTLDEIRQAQQECSTVGGKPDALQMIVDIKHALSGKGVSISDRRWRIGLKVVKANAWLCGRAETEPDDVAALVPALWRDPGDKRTVEQIVYQYAAPVAAEAIAKEDMAHEIYQGVHEEGQGYDTRGELETALAQLDHLYQELESKHPESNPRAQQALDLIGNLQSQLAVRYQPYLQLAQPKRRNRRAEASA